MKTLIYFSFSICLLIACSSTNNKPTSQSPNEQFIQDKSIDYKKNTYNFYLGQSVDSIEKVIEIRHDYLTDGGIINKNGETNYFSISEDFIIINGSQYIPVLYFKTDKQILTGFRCSILFYPQEYKYGSILKYLDEIKPLFTVLNSLKNRKTLAKTLKLTIDSKGFKESIYLDTLKSNSNIHFCYQKEIK